MKCQDAKELIGSEPYLVNKDGSQIYPNPATTSKVKKNKEKVDSNITKSSSLPTKRKVSPKLKKYSEALLGTGNSPVAKQRKTMSGKKLAVLVNNMNLAKDLSKETINKTGKKSNKMQSLATLMPSPEIFTSNITTTSVESGQTIFNQLAWTDLVQFSGAQLTLVNHIGHGGLPEQTSSVKIHVVSSGMATQVKALLLSMNLEELSTLRTCYGGLTSIHVSWKLKEVQNHSWQPSTISHPTLNRGVGTQTWTPKPWGP